jgi:hypothetical protein
MGRNISTQRSNRGGCVVAPPGRHPVAVGGGSPGRETSMGEQTRSPSVAPTPGANSFGSRFTLLSER